MTNIQIFFPAIYLVALTFVLAAAMARGRLRAVYNRAVDPAYYLLQRNGAEPDQLRQMSRHYSNLFELPVTFYLLVVIAAVTQAADGVLLALCWGFAALRTLHALIHTGSNHLKYRMYAFMGGFVILALAWMYLTYRLLTLA
ncbi:MAPEG family protein [Microbulbifer sp. SAOS-129_SWC]|uniref:MAPEG family protein n=1 Tax=Microbulbifer sp. SAOS-129_SWC TaxID=3145235 RepID=UPI003217A3D8